MSGRWPLVLRRGAFVVVIVALPLAKWWQFEGHAGHDTSRQLLLLVVVALIVLLAVPRARVAAVFCAHVALPAPASYTGDKRPVRLMLGLSAVGLAALAVVILVRQPAGDAPRPEAEDAALVLVALSLAPVIALALWEVRRARGTQPQPDRAVLWMVAPAIMWFAILLLQAWARGRQLDPLVDGATCRTGAPCPELWFDGAAGRAVFTVVVVGLSEELLYRGLLLVLAVAARLEQLGFALVSLGFAGWHLPDALTPTMGAGRWLLAGGTFVAMFLASHLILVPLRLRCRTVAGPALLHAANNLGLRLL